jgi:UDP-2,3-diacylglucosamine hydrolase
MKKNDRHSIFIADLHLAASNKHLAQLFFKFLKEEARQADALYILGDLFVLWAGDDDRSPFHEKIKAALKELSSGKHGVPVYIIPGNRDFLLGEKFAKESGCTLLKDPSIINLYGRKTLITHGDQLSSSERVHHLFRSVMAQDYMQKLFFKFPLWARSSAAWLVHGYSCVRGALISSRKLIVIVQNEAQQAMKKHKVQQVIHGHIHRSELFEYKSGNGKGKKSARHIILGMWDDKYGSILIYKANGECEFKNLI